MAANTEVERRLLAVWSEVLGIDIKRLSVEDNFFDLGGDSLLSLQIVSKCLTSGIHVTVRQIFDQPTIRKLGSVLELPTLAKPLQQALFKIKHDPFNPNRPFPMIGVQRAFWVGQMLSSDQFGINPHLYMEYEMEGLDINRLESAINCMISRHPMFRAIVCRDGTLQVLNRVAHYSVTRTSAPETLPEVAIFFRSHRRRRMRRSPREMRPALTMTSRFDLAGRQD